MEDTGNPGILVIFREGLMRGKKPLNLSRSWSVFRLVYRELLGLLGLLGRRTTLEGRAEGRANLGLFCATIWSMKSSSGGEGKGREMG